MSRTTFTIAGDLYEYISFLEREGLHRDTKLYTFISDPLRLYDSRGKKVLCVGKYWLSPVYQFDYDEIIGRKHDIEFVSTLGEEIKKPATLSS